MDAKLAIPIPEKVSHQLGAAIGVGTEVGSSNAIFFYLLFFSKKKYELTAKQTAGLGVFRGLGIKLPDPKALPEVKDEWVVILGGAGSVGQYAVQVRDIPNKHSSIYHISNIEAI